jgi:TRAP-type mannitol/chloroaromatic compound transport system permease large subunit
MELFFLLLLMLLMALALGSGYPVAFALPGSAIIAIAAAAACGYLFAGNTDAYFAQGGPGQWLSAGVTNLRGIYWEPERDTLIAIPLFIFMGIMLQRSRIAEDLLITMAQLFGPIPGGLGISVVFVGALLAATTGIVGATVVAMGLISLPAMLRNNYSKPLATGTIAASGTLGQIIPPSIVLIILADQLASAADQAGTARQSLYREATGELTMPTAFDVSPTSAGEMFLGAFIPGIVLVGLYMVFILVFALIRPAAAPAVPREGGIDRAFAIKVVITLVPPLTLILLVLGSIIGGVATVNQAGAIGASGAMIMAGYKLMEGERGAYRPAILAIVSLIALGVILSFFNTNVKAMSTSRDVFGIVLASTAVAGLVVALSWSAWRAIKIDRTMHGVVIETSKTTSLVFIILLGAAMLTAAFRGFGGEELVREFLGGLPGGFWPQFIIVMAVIFVLGFFLDFIEIAVVVVPIVAPILLADPGANITAVWLGVMIGLNIQTSFLTPPFGFALFYLRGVADATVRTIEMYKGVIAFILLQLVALFIVGLAPPLVNYLPNRMSLLAETAPPPRNPRLQYCIEEYVFDYVANDEPALRQLLSTARSLDFSVLPESEREDLIESLNGIESLFAAIANVRAAEASVDEAAPEYRPLHGQVRDIQRQVRKLAVEIGLFETRRQRARGETDAMQDRRARLDEEITELREEQEALREEIPQDWETVHDAFAELIRAEENARNLYRRTADAAYAQLRDVVNLLRSAGQLDLLGPAITDIEQAIAAAEVGTAMQQFEQIIGALSTIAESNDIRSPLSAARRALEGDSPNLAEAASLVDEARAALQQAAQQRNEPAGELLPVLSALETNIRNNIGLRQQERLPREQALLVAACASRHRDVSLNF